jgi:Ca-activated chloride channel family protein
MTRLRFAALTGILCVTLAFGQANRAQNPTSPRLRVDVDLVLVNVTVTDAFNRYVTGLGQENFQLWEDKVEHPIEYFSAENVPLSAGIIFDTSSSMENKLVPALAAANTLLSMSDPEDEYFLVRFSDSPELAQDFTTDIGKLQSQFLLTQARGTTSLYDALYLGIEKVARGSNARKAVILITDGEDNHSRYSLSDVKELAKERDVLVYSIGIVDPVDVQFPNLWGRATLQSLADLTGGVAFFPRQLDALVGMCARIGQDLKNQYVLGYRPSNHSNDGKWRKIQVKIKVPKGAPRLNVRSKTGYYAPAFARK